MPSPVARLANLESPVAPPNGWSDNKRTPINPIKMATRPINDTPSSKTRIPTQTAWITSVFLKVMPTAKLRVRNKATTQTVANIWLRPPTAAYPQNARESCGGARSLIQKYPATAIHKSGAE